MSTYNPEITKFIENAPEFERPMLNHIRELIHKTCPEVEEVVKWKRPHFDYRGKGMCFLDALKVRATFGFWYDSLIYGSSELSKAAKESKEQLGQLKSMSDLPSDAILSETIKLAMENIEQGKKVAQVSRPKKELVIPAYFPKALSKNKKAEANFNAMSPSHKKEYVEWIDDAKTEETREKRIAQMIEWLVEGKSRHWKYQK